MGGMKFRILEGMRWMLCVWVVIMAEWMDGDHGRERYGFFENLSWSFFWPLTELQKCDPNTRPLSLVAVIGSLTAIFSSTKRPLNWGLNTVEKIYIAILYRCHSRDAHNHYRQQLSAGVQ